MILWLAGCGPSKSEYNEYPESNDEWFPVAIVEKLLSKDAEVTKKESTYTDTYHDNNCSEYVEGTIDQYTYDMSNIMIEPVDLVTLQSVGLEQRYENIMQHGCGSEYNNESGSSFGSNDGPDNEGVHDNIDYISIYNSTLFFIYELEGFGNCEARISRYASLDTSDSALWHFREYPYEPDMSDTNTCSSFQSSMDTFEAISTIIYE